MNDIIRRTNVFNLYFFLLVKSTSLHTNCVDNDINGLYLI